MEEMVGMMHPDPPAALLKIFSVSFHSSYTVRLNIYSIIKKEVAGGRKTPCGSINSCCTKILNYPR